MRDSRPPRSFLTYLRWPLIGIAGLAFAGGAIGIGLHMKAEYEWQNYENEAAENGVFLRLDEPGEGIPAEKNLAGAPPFAPVRVGEDGKPIDPPTLRNDLVPNDILADLLQGKRADFAAARQTLAPLKLGLPLGNDREVAEAILVACDKQLGARWSQVLAAEAKEDAYFNIRYWPLPMTQKLPISDLRIAAQIHALRATALLHVGRGKEAVEEIRGALALANAVFVDPGLIAFMMRTAIIGLEMSPVWEGLAAKGWSDADLAELEKMLGDVRVGLGYARAVDSERGFFNAICQDLILRPGKGTCDEARELAAVVAPTSPFPGERHVQGWIVRDNQLVLNRYYDAMRERIDSDGDWHAVEAPQAWEAMAGAKKKHYALAALAKTDFSKSESRVAAIAAWVRQARLAIALERFRRAKGTLPADLNALVPDYLADVLEDPMDGEPMRYARDAAGAYRLWSIGDDHEDDHGAADTEMVKMTKDLVWPGVTGGK